MEYNPRVQIIPAKPKPRDKRVAIYARVSSNSAEQLKYLVYFKQNTEEPNQLSPEIIEKLGEFIQKHKLQSESIENDKELLWIYVT